MAITVLAVFRQEGAHLGCKWPRCDWSRSRLMTYNHLYLFLRSLQQYLLHFSLVRLQFIHCPEFRRARLPAAVRETRRELRKSSQYFGTQTARKQFQSPIDDYID